MYIEQKQGRRNPGNLYSNRQLLLIFASVWLDAYDAATFLRLSRYESGQCLDERLFGNPICTSLSSMMDGA